MARLALMQTTSLLDQAIYSYADVDRLNGLTPGTGRRWLEGHRRAGVFYEPVLRPEPTGANTVTWGEMVEARLLAEFRGQRVSLQRLRPAVVRLREEFGSHPLAHASPLLDVEGRELVRKVQDEVSLERQLQLVVVRNDQLMLDLRTERFRDAVTYEGGVVVAIRPAARTQEVIMDPQSSFGQPSVRGVRTDVLAEDFRAGESRESMADLYDLSLSQVDQAIRYEMISSAAQAG
jgi:uncharacterized protein (DUF433 family)